MEAYSQIALTCSQFRISKVLDIGAGTGRLGLILRKSGYRGPYRGFDKRDDNCDVMRARNLDADEGDLRWIDYRAYSWDAVVMQGIIRPNDLALLDKAVPLARRLFFVTTTYGFFDKLTPAPPPSDAFPIDDILVRVATHSFHLHRSHRFDDQHLLVFTRRRKHE